MLHIKCVQTQSKLPICVYAQFLGYPISSPSVFLLDIAQNALFGVGVQPTCSDFRTFYRNVNWWFHTALSTGKDC